MSMFNIPVVGGDDGWPNGAPRQHIQNREPLGLYATNTIPPSSYCTGTIWNAIKQLMLYASSEYRGHTRVTTVYSVYMDSEDVGYIKQQLA